MNLHPRPAPAWPARPGWLVSPAWDLGFFFCGALLAALAGGLALAWPGLLVPLVVGWLLLIDGPHFAATWLWSSLDPASRAAHGRALRRGWLWLGSGLAALALARLLGERLIFELYLLFGLLWGFHHFIRQNHGLLSLMHRLQPGDGAGRRRDVGVAYALQWGMLGLYLAAHPLNRAAVGLPPASGLERALFLGLGAALVALAAGYGLDLLRRWRAGRPARPGLFVLLPVCGLFAFSFFFLAPHEPLAARPTTPEQQLLATQMTSSIYHGIQYLGLGLVIRQRRWADGSAPGVAAGLGRRPLLAYGALVLVSGLYVALNVLRGSLPGWQPLPLQGLAEDAFMAVFFGILLHHYYVDQHIWRPHRDPQLRAELGVEPAPG